MDSVPHFQLRLRTRNGNCSKPNPTPGNVISVVVVQCKTAS